MILQKLDIQRRRLKLGLYVSRFTETKPTWNKDINLRPETLRTARGTRQGEYHKMEA